MSTYKIVFAGPVGAGKTTSIAAISDIEPFTTEEFATDEVSALKEKTTVAMDYGLMELGNGEHIHLYGVPGQMRFDFMWEIITEGGIGLILLLNNENEKPLEEMAVYLDSFKDFIDRTALAIGVTRMQPGKGPGLEDYAASLAQRGMNAPIFEVDGRKSEDVVTLVQSLLYTLDPGLMQPAELAGARA
jgi:signal recognition particle receptor subunit beta